MRDLLQRTWVAVGAEFGGYQCHKVGEGLLRVQQNGHPPAPASQRFNAHATQNIGHRRTRISQQRKRWFPFAWDCPCRGCYAWLASKKAKRGILKTNKKKNCWHFFVVPVISQPSIAGPPAARGVHSPPCKAAPLAAILRGYRLPGRQSGLANVVCSAPVYLRKGLLSDRVLPLLRALAPLIAGFRNGF